MAYVTSTFLDATNPGLATAVSPRKAVLIFGLATKGPMYQRIKITPDTVGEIFGNIPDYNDEDQKDFYNRALVKEAYDLFALLWDNQGVILQEYDFYGIRIGNAKSATISIDEIELKSHTDVTIQSTKSITFTANEANEEANSWYVIVGGTNGHVPEYLTITCGTVSDTVFFNATESYDSKTFTNIVDAIEYFNNQSEISQYLKLSYETFNVSSTIKVDKDNDAIVREYDLYTDDENASSNPTFSLYRPIKKTISASLVGNATYTSTEKGVSVITLSKTPVKSDIVSTIIDGHSKFTITDELLLTIDADHDGSSDPVFANLSCESDMAYRDQSSPNVTITSVEMVRGNVKTILTPSDANDFYYSQDQYTVTIHTKAGATPPTFKLGDYFLVSYTYDVTFVEAKTTADIVPTVKNQYFVYGNDISFNAAIPEIVSFEYNANTQLEEYSDYVINGSTVTIQSNVDMAEDEELVFVFEVYPAFPDITSRLYLTGGTSDVHLTETAYRDVILRGFNATYGTVARYILVAGMYMDSTASLLNSVTGKPEIQLVDYLARVKDYLTYKNRNVSHCECVIGNKRFEVESYSNITAAKNNYLANLIAIDNSHRNNVAQATASFTSMFVILAVHMGERINPQIRPVGMSPYVDAATHILAVKLITSILNPVGYPITTLASAPSAIASLTFDTDVNIFNRMKNMRYTFAYYYYQLDGSVVIKYYDAPTAAAPKSQYRRQGLNAILYDAIDRCRAYILPQIGKPVADNGVALRLGLNNIMKDYYIKTGILNGVDVTIRFVGDTITKEAKIGLKVYSLAELIGAEIETSIDAGEIVENE